MSHAELAAQFVQCSQTDLYGVRLPMITVGIPSRAQVKFRQIFEIDRLYTDPDLYFNASDSANWRTTAFCFAAAMTAAGDFK